MRPNLKSKPLLLSLIALTLLVLGFFRSASFRNKVRKIITRTEITVSKLRGYEPRLVSISGSTGMPGAQVQALNSRSGWGTFCDIEGRFTLHDVLWYPGATYDLLVSTDECKGNIVKISAPSSFPASAVLEAGTLSLDSGAQVDLTDLPGITSESDQYFDIANRDYYRSIFDELTKDKNSDEERVDAINDYIATRLNYNETQWELGSPRRVLERGSQYCGHLSSAMATILAAVLPVRIIQLTDRDTPPNTHVVVEVFYDRDWHLFDPTFGVKFKNKEGRVVSYRELRMHPGLVSLEDFARFRKKYLEISLNSLAKMYTSGDYHYYYLAFRCSQYAHAFWEYKNGLNHVPAGGRINLAAAGILPGTNVTYHIRKPGSDQDELTFSSRGRGNNNCVLVEEESPAINLPPGLYDIFADLRDGNVLDPTKDGPAFIRDRRLRFKLEVR